MMIFTFWLLGTALVCFIAKAMNQSAGKMFFISIVLSPVIGLIVLLFSGVNGKNCPKCAEKVKPEAVVCKHCGHDFQSEMNEQEKVKRIEDETSRIKSV